MEWNDLTEGAKAVLEQTRNMKNDHIQIVEFEIGFEQEPSTEESGPHAISIQEADYENLKRFVKVNEYGELYHMARNKDVVKIIILENGKIPDNLSEFPVFRQYKKEALIKDEIKDTIKDEVKDDSNPQEE